MTFYIRQKIMDLCKQGGYNTDGFEVMKELPRVPNYTFTVSIVEPRRIKGQPAQWKRERNGKR